MPISSDSAPGERERHPAVLRLTGVAAGYGGAAIVSGVSISVAPGEVVSVIGPNGAGKSTLLKAVTGRLPVMAYRCNDFAYATDLSEISEATLNLMQNLDVLVLDCLRFTPHPTHLWVEKALEYVEKIKPRRAFFTHIAHDVKYARDSVRLPEGVEWAYDGLTVMGG